ESDVTAEIDRALSVFREITGGDPDGFAAPGWQCSAASVSCLDRGPFVYHSSTRGTHPYRPRIDGVEGKLPEIPTTLPSLDDLLGLGIGEADALERIRGSLSGDPLNVLPVHAEVEGGPCLDAFTSLVDRLRPTTRFERLIDVARELTLTRLPVLPVSRGTRPGRAGTVACQAE